MKKNLLVAITGAVNAYIQQEEAGRAASGVRMSAWRLLGQREQMRARTVAKRIRPKPGVGVWQYHNMEEAMAARARWSIDKAAE